MLASIDQKDKAYTEGLIEFRETVLIRLRIIRHKMVFQVIFADKKEDGSFGGFPCQSVGLLTDSYIKQNIIFSDSSRPYGDATYFGRKFFYKTKSGARIVATLPFLSHQHRDLTKAKQSHYPRLADAVGLLDRLVSSRFSNALFPLVSANAEAAIPLRLGNKILEKLAKELMAEDGK